MPEVTAKEMMTPEPTTVGPETPVTDAARIMVAERIGALPVVEAGELIGLVTEGDLIMSDVRLQFPTYIHLLDGFIMYPPTTARFEHELRKAVAAKVRDVMTAEPTTVQVSASLEDVATLMVERNVSRLPVLDGGELVGIITKSDVVRSMFGGQQT